MLNALQLDDPDTHTDGSADTVLARKVRRLRHEAQLTLQQLSKRCGISVSALSKIEKGQLSPTYERIAALARGLHIQVGELFNDEEQAPPSSRLTVTRRGTGVRHETAQYDYEVLCTELASKQFVPLFTTVKAKSVKQFPALLQHDGEEFIYVLEGNLTVYTQFYKPVELSVGDSCYFDSSMGHACVAGDEDARILWVCSNVALE